MEEGEGKIELYEPFLPDKKIYLHLYTKEELQTLLKKHGFETIGQDMRCAMHGEFPYNKILLIARKIDG